MMTVLLAIQNDGARAHAMQHLSQLPVRVLLPENAAQALSSLTSIIADVLVVARDRVEFTDAFIDSCKSMQPTIIAISIIGRHAGQGLSYIDYALSDSFDITDLRDILRIVQIGRAKAPTYESIFASKPE